jgi:hypothetical protein
MIARFPQAIRRAKWRLQFRRDVCQALYSPKGSRGRQWYERPLEAFHRRPEGARGANRDEVIQG